MSFEFWSKLFDSSDFVPRRFCGAWTNELVGLHTISDALIWLAYLAIPVLLIFFARRKRNLPFPWIFWMFGAFIISCGFTHFFEVLVFVEPVYRLSILMKFITAIVSWATVLALIPVLPKALALRTPEQLEREVALRTAELVRVNQALSDSKQELNTVLETAPCLMVLTNAAGQILLFNKACEELTGLPRARVLGRTIRELFLPPEAMGTFEEQTSDALAGKPVSPREVPWLDKDDRQRVIEWRVSALVCPDTSGLCVLSTGVDTTERKRLEEQIGRTHRMAAIGHLAGGVAHHFNNILTVINGYSELIRESLPSDQATQGYLEAILQAGDRAGTLTRQLLAFGRKAIVRARVLQLNDIIQQSQEWLRRLLPENIEMAVNLEATHRVKLDPGQFEQVLLALTLNARDAMAETGGRLSLETSDVLFDDVDVQIRPGLEPGNYVCLMVGDTGCGMNEDTKAHVFEPFFTTKGYAEATGMGLASVYAIMQQSSGFIEFESSPGRGSTFRLFFPPATEVPAPAEEERGRASQSSSAANVTVLLAEDEGAVRKLTARILRQRGFIVLEANDGQEALEVRGKHAGEIHLLLTDVLMPRMSGVELAQHLRRLQPDLRVIFMTGHAEGHVHREALLRGGGRLLEKPFSPSELLREIHELLERPKDSGTVQPGKHS